jgi:predicted dehydrogenase
MLTVSLSHFLDPFNFILGDFKSLSATLATRRTSVIVQETQKTIPQTTPDQIIVQGTLQSGAVASIHFRGGGGFAEKGSHDLLWEIEGEDGIITVTGPTAGNIQVRPSHKFLVFLFISAMLT